MARTDGDTDSDVGTRGEGAVREQGGLAGDGALTGAVDDETGSADAIGDDHGSSDGAAATSGHDDAAADLPGVTASGAE